MQHELTVPGVTIFNGTVTAAYYLNILQNNVLPKMINDPHLEQLT
jgi:hypothetical protein